MSKFNTRTSLTEKWIYNLKIFKQIKLNEIYNTALNVHCILEFEHRIT